MKYNKVYIEAFGYELPPVVVSTAELENRLDPVYKKLGVPAGQIEAWTGILERRWWEPGFKLSDGATAAAEKALDKTSVEAADLGAVIYGGVNREFFEPATACAVANNIGAPASAAVHDISNACLGAINGMIDVANRIELGQIRAGLVVSCETAREINEIMIERMLENPEMETFSKALATITGGSGAVAILLTDGSFDSSTKSRKFAGGVCCGAPQFHELCRWGIEPKDSEHNFRQFILTDSTAVLKNGVELGIQTFDAFLKELNWTRDLIDKTVCHQVGKAHQDTILQSIQLSPDNDFATYPFLGNTGTVALPISAAIAEERDFLEPGDKVALMGIASGLNCMILGVEW